MGGGVEGSDGAAHGVAHHVETLHPKLLQYLVDVIYLILKTVTDVQGFTAVAMAWQIEGIDVELTLELFGQTGPVILVGAEAVNQNQGVTINRFFAAKIGNVQIANGDLRGLQAGAGALPASGASVDALAAAGDDQQGNGQQQEQLQGSAAHGDPLFVRAMVQCQHDPIKQPGQCPG